MLRYRIICQNLQLAFENIIQINCSFLLLTVPQVYRHLKFKKSKFITVLCSSVVYEEIGNLWRECVYM